MGQGVPSATKWNGVTEKRGGNGWEDPTTNYDDFSIAA